MFKELKISYTVWKEIAQSNSHQTYYLELGEDNVKAITGHREAIFWTIVDSDNYNDWSTNFLSDASEETNINDAFAKICGLNSKPIPRSADGKQFVLPTTFGKDVEVYFPGRGDDVGEKKRLRGPRLELNQSGVGENSLDWQYIEPIHICGGKVRFSGAAFGDWVRYQVYCPETPYTENVGAGEFATVPIGGGVEMFVPGGGDYDLNLTEKNASDLLTVNPIKSYDNTGFFDYDELEQTITINYNQKGNCHLFAQDFVLTEIVNDIGLLGTGQEDFLVPSSFAAKPLWPQWKHEVTINRASAGSLDVVWYLFAGRKSTIPQ